MMYHHAIGDEKEVAFVSCVCGQTDTDIQSRRLTIADLLAEQSGDQYGSVVRLACVTCVYTTCKIIVQGRTSAKN